jgi:hypothetical protein
MHDHRASGLLSENRSNRGTGGTGTGTARFPRAALKEYRFNIMLVKNSYKRDVSTVGKTLIYFGKRSAYPPIIAGYRRSG